MELLRHGLDLLKQMIDQAWLAEQASAMGPWFYVFLFAVIFCETGLVVTPFLPGDSLLFAVGAVVAHAAAGASGLNLPLLFAVLAAAAVLGDAVNYAAGWWIGPRIFKSEGSWLLNKKHLLRAQEFYERYGNKAIVLARFVPIVRTFAPFVAGIGKMRYGRFFVYNVIGGVAWVAICLFSGVFFAGFDFVKNHFELVVVAIVFISVLPMAVELVLSRWRKAGAVVVPPEGTQAHFDADRRSEERVQQAG